MYNDNVCDNFYGRACGIIYCLFIEKPLLSLRIVNLQGLNTVLLQTRCIPKCTVLVKKIVLFYQKQGSQKSIIGNSQNSIGLSGEQGGCRISFSSSFLSFFFFILSLNIVCSEEATCFCPHLGFLKALKQFSGYGTKKNAYKPVLQLAWRVCQRGHTLFLRRSLGVLNAADLHIYQDWNFYIHNSSTFLHSVKLAILLFCK